MRLLFFCVVIAMIAGCGHSAIGKKISGSDSLVIQFNAPAKDSVIKTVQTTDKDAIRKMTDFIDSKVTGERACGFDGNMSFYAHGELLQAFIFEYRNKDCRHFLYESGPNTVYTSLSNEAADFLESLEEGKLFY